MYNLLIADDESSIISGLDLFFSKQKEFKVFTANEAESALSILEKEEIDIVLTDLMIPEIENGESIIQKAKSMYYSPIVLAMTAFEIIENVIWAMKAGADDLIIKGFKNDELLIRIDNLIKKKEVISNLTVQNTALKNSLKNEFNNYELIGESKHIRDLQRIISKVAQDASSTCLITGPSGCGKELVARSIHEQSSRCDQPLIPINCAAMPDTLIESELFGHEKGAFTNAIRTRIGKFESAGNGIIFLDEIGDLPLNLQMRLLRVLEERSFTRVGANKELQTDAMIIAATNKDLNELLAAGKFRDDLYYRLNVINIKIQPLAEHTEDIPHLAEFFLSKLNNDRSQRKKFTDNALNKLSSYNFPGNVRELRNIIENAFVLSSDSLIHIGDLQIQLMMSGQSTPLDAVFELPHHEALKRFERKYFKDLMVRFHGKIADAAKYADLSNEWFGKKLKQLNLK